jgi:hypothetical protein
MNHRFSFALQPTPWPGYTSASDGVRRKKRMNGDYETDVHSGA